LVDEVFNGRDKVVEELMGGKAVGERHSREEDKGEGRTQGEGSWVLGYFVLWEGKKIWRGGRRRAGNNNFVIIWSSIVHNTQHKAQRKYQGPKPRIKPKEEPTGA
jgi:hypothetical protein